MNKKIAELADEFTKRWGYKNGMYTDVRNVITSAVKEERERIYKDLDDFIENEHQIKFEDNIRDFAKAIRDNNE